MLLVINMFLIIMMSTIKFISNGKITYILKSSILNENILCNDWTPPWMNRYLKTIILTKHKMHKLFARKKKYNHLCNSFNKLQKKLNETIGNAKRKYLLRISTNKINNPSKNSKFYCSHLQTLLNSKKTPIIQLVFHNNRYMADSKGKSELFNFFFSER